MSVMAYNPEHDNQQFLQLVLADTNWYQLNTD